MDEHADNRAQEPSPSRAFEPGGETVAPGGASDESNGATVTAGGWRPIRLPSQRASALLAAIMLGAGVAAGAAIGPAPDVSFAGGGNEIARRLALAALVAQEGRAPATAASSSPRRKATPGASEANEPAAGTATSTSGSAVEPASAKKEETSGEKSGAKGTGKKKSTLPPISSVWLIELSGTSFSTALAQPAAAPFTTQTVGQGALLSGWSSLAASAFASESALAQPPTEGAAPPLLRAIVQPPCPEGAAGQACAPETPGQLTSADEFLRATLATITSTPAYTEHGLVVITFTTVGLPTQAGLPEGASSSTLTYQPPAGALLLSPFVHAGAKPTVTFDPTSPRKSLERLLHT